MAPRAGTVGRRVADTNGQAPSRRTEQRESTLCGAKGVKVEVESQAPSPVLFVAGADARCALSVRTVPAHRLPQGQAQCTVQQRRTEEHERSVWVL